MAEIIMFPGITTLDLNPDRVLEAALKELESVVVVGFAKDGEEYFASSIANGPEVLWLLERAKKILLETTDD